MNLARAILIVAAIAVAGLTAYLVKTFIDSRDQDAEKDKAAAPAAEVLVADRNLPAGTILRGEHLKWQRWPERGINKAYIQRSKEETIEKYLSYVVQSYIYAGEPILKRKLITPWTQVICLLVAYRENSGKNSMRNLRRIARPPQLTAGARLIL